MSPASRLLRKPDSRSTRSAAPVTTDNSAGENRVLPEDPTILAVSKARLFERLEKPGSMVDLDEAHGDIPASSSPGNGSGHGAGVAVAVRLRPGAGIVSVQGAQVVVSHGLSERHLFAYDHVFGSQAHGLQDQQRLFEHLG